MLSEALKAHSKAVKGTLEFLRISDYLIDKQGVAGSNPASPTPPDEAFGEVGHPPAIASLRSDGGFFHL
jgi:hypothetical protein